MSCLKSLWMFWRLRPRGTCKIIPGNTLDWGESRHYAFLDNVYFAKATSVPFPCSWTRVDNGRLSSCFCWGKSMDRSWHIMKLAGQSTNYSTITQSFTLIDLVDEGSFFRWAVRRTETAVAGMWPCGSSVVFRRGVTVTFWISGSPENLRPGCWDRKVGVQRSEILVSFSSRCSAPFRHRQVTAGGFFDCYKYSRLRCIMFCLESGSTWCHDSHLVRRFQVATRKLSFSKLRNIVRGKVPLTNSASVSCSLCR